MKLIDKFNNVVEIQYISETSTEEYNCLCFTIDDIFKIIASHNITYDHKTKTLTLDIPNSTYLSLCHPTKNKPRHIFLTRGKYRIQIKKEEKI